MTKTLTYPAFALAALIVIVFFVTAKTYSELAVGIVLYPILIFLALMIFPRKGATSPKNTASAPLKLSQGNSEPKPKTETAYIADIDKRTFIKLIGATGISFFLFSLLGRRVDSLLFARTGQFVTNTDAVRNNQFGANGDSPTAGYKISEIDEGPVTYYGFTNHDRSWLIMREGKDGSSFRYAKGSSDFPGNWKSRENLRYDYYYNLF